MNDQNRRAYDKIAEDYHAKRTDPTRNAWNEFLEVPTMERLLKPLVPHKRVLDLGCGSGLLTQKIYQWGGDAFGIDVSPKMIEIADSQRLQAHFQVGEAEHLPYAAEAFDVVASSLVLHYIEDLTLPFREVARVLKSGGQFVFTMHHPLQEVFKKDGVPNGEPVILQPYFHSEAYTWTLCGELLINYHHTFEEIFKTLHLAGLQLQDLIECRPDPSARAKFDGYEFTSKYPTFLALRVMKS